MRPGADYRHSLAQLGRAKQYRPETFTKSGIMVGLGEERYREVQTYSTGMRQKQKLAQAIVHDPRLVFLDEPTSGLDPLGRQRMLKLIRGLYDRTETSVVLSTHILHDV